MCTTSPPPNDGPVRIWREPQSNVSHVGLYTTSSNVQKNCSHILSNSKMMSYKKLLNFYQQPHQHKPTDTKTLHACAQPACNHKDRSCYDYCSSDSFPPPWSYTVIGFVQPYKSRPHKTTATKRKKFFITSDVSDNDSYCWLSVSTEKYLLTFRNIMAQSVDSVLKSIIQNINKINLNTCCLC